MPLKQEHIHLPSPFISITETKRTDLYNAITYRQCLEVILNFVCVIMCNVLENAAMTPYKKPPQIFCDVRLALTTRQITLTSFSRMQPITIDYWVTWH